MSYLDTSDVFGYSSEIQSESAEKVRSSNRVVWMGICDTFRIQSLIKDRNAYLISSVTHLDDLYISEYLNIPIYGRCFIHFTEYLM